MVILSLNQYTAFKQFISIVETTKHFRAVSSLEERKYHRKSAFINGVAVGFGIGCFATFAALLITAFYYSQVADQTLEGALASFSLPIIYFFILGILFLIVGSVWERFEKQPKL